MSPATISDIRKHARSSTPVDGKVIAIADAVGDVADDVAALAVRGETNGLAILGVGETCARIEAALGELSARVESNEDGILECLAIIRAEQTARQQAVADARASGAALEAQLVPVQADAAAMRAFIADASRKAGNAGATKATGAVTLSAVVVGLAAEPAAMGRLLREIGPMGAAIAVVLFFVALVWARFRRS